MDLSWCYAQAPWELSGSGIPDPGEEAQLASSRNAGQMASTTLPSTAKQALRCDFKS